MMTLLELETEYRRALAETIRALELDVALAVTPMTSQQDGRQSIVLTYAAANAARLFALALK